HRSAAAANGGLNSTRLDSWTGRDAYNKKQNTKGNMHTIHVENKGEQQQRQPHEGLDVLWAHHSCMHPPAANTNIDYTPYPSKGGTDVQHNWEPTLLMCCSIHIKLSTTRTGRGKVLGRVRKLLKSRVTLLPHHGLTHL
ncbi:unnamed protein product, partial [Ectocarpus sp. 4 AP-2014]